MASMSLPVRLSIVVPAFNEEENIAPLVAEVEAMAVAAPFACELIIVDDGSTDGTAGRAAEAAETRPWLRVIRMRRNGGQSAAFHAGIRAARGELVGMLDADLQNDAADLPRMVELLESSGADWVQGCRRKRNDGNRLKRRFSSWVGRTFRARMLGDTIRDTGCSARVFRRAVGLELPLQYRGMHRFMPVYARKLGFKVVEMDVNHRPRHAGVAKYGTFDRARQGLRDLFAVRWMFNRIRPVAFDEVERAAGAPIVEVRPAGARERAHAPS